MHSGPVLLDPHGRRVTLADIRARAAQLAALGDRPLTFLNAATTLEAITDFLALRELRWPVFLMDPHWTDEQRQRLIERYQPGLLLPGGPTGATTPTHPDLGVLLTTSGSTGSPKLVRLSHENVDANARQIAASLGLGPADRGVTALPLHYSFGMSIVTSHAASGGSILVTDASLLDRGFWAQLDDAGVTLLPGVPQSYAILKRIGLPELPALRGLLQAGGRLDPALIEIFAQQKPFYVMYGQTEAGPRMACLPPNRLADKLGSVGQALPGGQFRIDDGEVVYRGPNVMMGYAEHVEDLILPDMQGDELHTGDLGYLDDEGFLFLTGRLKRIVKLAGNRVALDEVEALVPELAPVAAVDGGDAGVVLFSEAEPSVFEGSRKRLARELRIPVALVEVRGIEQLPVMSSGKVDYERLARMTNSARDAS